MNPLAFRTSLLISCLAMIGCATGAGQISDGSVGASEDAVTSTNRLSMNRLSMNRLSIGLLSRDRLSPDRQRLADTALLRDEAGRELLRYTVRCALPEGRSLRGVVDGETFIFNGLIGLAPEWLDKPLSDKGQRWISACLLAHVDGYGIEVPISLRGSHPALATTAEERAVYRQEETTFFGNVFAAEGKSDEIGDIGPRMYACGGPGLASACSGDAFAPTRTCAGAADCPLEFLGPCDDLCAVGAAGYTRCQTEPVAQKDARLPKVKGIAVYDAVITVYLRDVQFESLYPSCQSEAL